ncbi:HpcH/HpaI aldolase family protein [Peribacillus muralis]|uniref:HpcH/HpaI aldolase family protein n=1 Tax=Peribacillus muralis TaxID=264697 RepID=UPI00070DA866|nr:aldolase/citrate lyase family protein [Peribacillus muralis]
MNIVKQRITNGEKVVGVFVGIYSPSIVEMIGYSGFDFVVIDDEHGAFSHSEIENMIRAAESVNLVPIVRVSYDPSSIQKALDRGAKGIQVPMINTKEDAENLIKRAKFPPLGVRGAAFSHRAAKYGKVAGKPFLDASDQETLIIIHIETPEAVKNFEEIMSVPGIDVAFIGPTDLSVTMGYKEGPEHPDVQEVIGKLYEKGRQMGVSIGTVGGNVDGVCKGLQRGASYVLTVSTSVISTAFTNVVTASKEYL